MSAIDMVNWSTTRTARSGLLRPEVLRVPRKIATGSNVLHLTDFESTNGPDLEVWLVRASDIQSSADVKGSEWISLGRLKGNIGDQTYIITEGTAISDYRSVVIWC